MAYEHAKTFSHVTLKLKVKHGHLLRLERQRLAARPRHSLRLSLDPDGASESRQR